MEVFVGSVVLPALLAVLALSVPGTSLTRSARDGRWSDPATWADRRVPGEGSRVRIEPGHVVTYDGQTASPIRSILIAGTLRFDPSRDTRLDVGLIRIDAGDDESESGFDCAAHLPQRDPARPRPALEVGTVDRPIAPERTAVIRLAPVPGLDSEECPAIVCCAGRMEFHGAPLSRTWVKLDGNVAQGDSVVKLAEAVAGWRVGDRVIVTATHRQAVPDDGLVPSVRDDPQTEERTIKSLDGTKLSLDAPLAFAHNGAGDYRGELANLSRNVIVESADPAGVRGHTMYHANSAGSISYAEFRHLGKSGKLGKYSLHFHRVGDTMRGASVVGASIWDSANRWITIHGTNYLVVRDCVGYRSLGHGFFLEDGTEVDNILDRNLAVQACGSSPLPQQVLAFDRNEGAGFWWANSRNAFTRNVAVECDEYGYRFDAPTSPEFNPVLSVRGHDGRRSPVDIRTLPFLRFEGNEAHAQRRYGLNLGGGPGSKAENGVGSVGPDCRHPFVVRGLRVWDAHWALTPAAPSVLLDDVAVGHSDFGLWRPRYDRHAHRGVAFFRTRWSAYAESGERPDPDDFPGQLDPVDDVPPVTVITYVGPADPGRLVIRGIAVDDGTIRAVRVNGRLARSTAAGWVDWEIVLEGLASGPVDIEATAEDAAGNIEADPHRRTVFVPPVAR
jgi:hypothetical protein